MSFIDIVLLNNIYNLIGSYLNGFIMGWIFVCFFLFVTLKCRTEIPMALLRVVQLVT